MVLKISGVNKVKMSFMKHKFIDLDQVLLKVVNSNVDLKVDVDVTNVNFAFY